ncbi:MAG: hypothetical protein ACHRXM_02165 [Isosphaerales bacterium]
MAAAVAPSWGCAHGPRRFGKIEHPAPLVRARAVGLGRRQPDSLVVPALVGRLGDADPVVRLAAHEELRRRTGQDFGYVPWASSEERSAAIDRWRAWLGQGRGSAAAGALAIATGQSNTPADLPLKTLPAGIKPTPNP